MLLSPIPPKLGEITFTLSCCSSQVPPLVPPCFSRTWLGDWLYGCPCCSQTGFYNSVKDVWVLSHSWLVPFSSAKCLKASCFPIISCIWIFLLLMELLSWTNFHYKVKNQHKWLFHITSILFKEARQSYPRLPEGFEYMFIYLICPNVSGPHQSGTDNRVTFAYVLK